LHLAGQRPPGTAGSEPDWADCPTIQNGLALRKPCATTVSTTTSRAERHRGLFAMNNTVTHFHAFGFVAACTLIAVLGMVGVSIA
jgi:hypothetical protein